MGTCGKEKKRLMPVGGGGGGGLQQGGEGQGNIYRTYKAFSLHVLQVMFRSITINE